MQTSTQDIQYTLLEKCIALKNFQNDFIIENRNSNDNNPFKAPEIVDSPLNWMEEYKAYGGSYGNPSLLNSRLQTILDLTQENSNFKEIMELVTNTNNDYIVWEIEKIYKKNFDIWNAFMFSLIASAFCSHLNNTAWNKWKKAHTDGWMLEYSDP